jgi:phosphomannomutase
MRRPAGLICGVSGARGVVGEGLDSITAAALGAAFGSFLGGGTIVLGRDSRISGPVIAGAVESGLRGVGCDVVQIGIVPTPTVQNHVRELGAAGGIAVTASHNPAEWNALKFVAGDGTFLTATAAEELFRRFDADRFAHRRYDALGEARDDATAIERHLARILALPILDPKAVAARRLKAVVDAVNGAGGLILPTLLRRLGVTVEEMNCEPTGRFARGPEPTRENLGALAARVRETHAHLGYACDPDVDRLSLVTGAGEPLGEEMTLALAVDFVLEHAGGGDVVTNVSTSMAIEEVAARHRGRVHRTAVGEANVVEKIRALGAVIGGEGNGGVIYPALGLMRDASVAAALVTQALAGGSSLAELATKVPRFAILKAKLPAGSADLEAVGRGLLAAAPGGTLDRTDGVKVRWADRWVHLRSSNTEPIMRLIAEARTPAEASELLDRARALAGAGPA